MYVDLTAGFWVVSLVLSVNTIGKSNKSVFIMADLKSLWPITLLTRYSCWFIGQRNHIHILAKHEI